MSFDSSIEYEAMSDAISDIGSEYSFYSDEQQQQQQQDFVDWEQAAVLIPRHDDALKQEVELTIQRDCEERLWEFHFRMQSLRKGIASPSPAEERALESFMGAYSELLVDSSMDAAAAASQAERQEVFTLEW